VRDLSQRKLAADVARSQSWLSAVEHGRINPRIADLTAIAGVLKVQLTQLLPKDAAEP
jgi:Helix-turn-helix.